jgi:hypothetical protein
MKWIMHRLTSLRTKDEYIEGYDFNASDILIDIVLMLRHSG